MATVIIQFCNRCEERKYLKVCKKCQQYLCSECKREHLCGFSSGPSTLYSSSEHLIKNIDNKPFQCRTHVKEVIRFCFTCTCELCEECLEKVDTDHKGHVIYNTEHAAKEIRKQTEAKIASLKEQIDKARKQKHELDKHRFSSTERQNTRREVTNLSSNLASAIVAAIEDHNRLNKAVVAESVTKLQKTIDVWMDMNRTLYKIANAYNDLENIHLFRRYIKVHENAVFPEIKTKAEFPDDRKYRHSELIQMELRALTEFIESATGINIPLPVKTEEEIARLVTAYDEDMNMEVDLATNPATRVQSRFSARTNRTVGTSMTKHDEDSLKYFKSENEALKMEISKLRKQTKEMTHATSLLSSYCKNLMQLTLMQEDDILEALKKPDNDDDELADFYRHISAVGQSVSKLRGIIMNENGDMDTTEDTQNHMDDTKSIQTRMTIETVENTSTANTVSTTLHDKMDTVPHLPPLSQRTQITQKSHRPKNIVYMYNKLYENEWTQALDILTQSGRRWAMDLVIKHLYIVLKANFRVCRDLEVQQLHNLIDTVFLADGGRKLPLTDIKPIMDLRRRVAVDTSVNIRHSIFKMQEFQAQLHKYSFKKDKLLKEIYETPFFGKSVYLCWCMALEEPPLCLDKEPPKGSVIDADLYREYTKGGKRVEYCVWPPLLLKEDGEILVKGIVQAH